MPTFPRGTVAVVTRLNARPQVKISVGNDKPRRMCFVSYGDGGFYFVNPKCDSLSFLPASNKFGEPAVTMEFDAGGFIVTHLGVETRVEYAD